MGWATSGKDVMSCMRKVAEQTRGNNPVGNVSPQPLLRFLTPGSYLSSYSDFSTGLPEIGMVTNHFLSNSFLVMTFYYREKNNQLRQNFVPGSWGTAVTDLPVLFGEGGLWGCLVLWAGKDKTITDQISDFYSIDFPQTFKFPQELKKSRSQELKAWWPVLCELGRQL